MENQIAIGYDLCLLSELRENKTKIGKIYLIIEYGKIKYKTHLTPDNHLEILEEKIFGKNIAIYTELCNAINKKNLRNISSMCKKFI